MVEKSFNELSGFTSKTKVLIVGTLTPPEGMAHGYFYTSCRAKKLYKLLDIAISQDGNNEHVLEESVKHLICERTPEGKRKAIDDINRILSAHGIAFFDVVDTADRVDPYSPSDDNLVDIKPAKEFFKERWDGKRNIRLFVFTSNNAKRWFELVEKGLITENNSIVWSIRKGKIVDEATIKRIRAVIGQ